jgi:ABC-type nitrate/sulfonate/bicarbonate transport system substrate-binding protein
VRDPRQHVAGDGVLIASVFGHSARLAGMVEWSDNSPAARRAGPLSGLGGDQMRSAIALRALAIAVSMVVVGCGGGAGGPSSVTSPSASVAATATATPQPVKIRAAYGNVTPANLAPFYAKEKGIFLQNGLDVDLSLIDGGGKAMAALLGNSVDIAQLGGTEAMSAYAGGADIEAVTLFVPVSPWVLMAPASYTGPNDLKGKTVGVASKGGSSEVAADQAIDKLGLKLSDVSILSTGSVANLTAAMLANQVYAGPGHPPDTAALVKAGFKVIMDLASQKVPAVENCTIVTKKWATDHKDLMQKYVDSLIQAIVAMKKDKAGTLPVMQKLLNVTDQDALSQTYDYYVTAIFPNYPEVTPDAWIYSRDQLVATNAAVKGLDVTKVIDNSFVKDAQTRKVGGS